MCPQMKLSKPVFRHVTANETLLAMPANETCPLGGTQSRYAHFLPLVRIEPLSVTISSGLTSDRHNLTQCWHAMSGLRTEQLDVLLLVATSRE
jgi:hypothetical protein